MSARDTPESGTLPGRHGYVVESEPMAVPTDPDWQRPSDVMREFTASGGATVERQDAISTPDPVDHNRGTEEPEATVAYDMQQFPVDGDGNPNSLDAYGLLRDEYNALEGTILYQERTRIPGGNDDAGIRLYTVVRGAAVESVEATLDPSEAQPILLECGLMPRKVRSYAIHQPSASTTLEITSTDDADTMDVTIENEGAGTTETISLTGTTSVTTTESFGDIDSVWLSEQPTGDITITDGSGTTFVELQGGLTYSDDDQPVDGDRGIPSLGAGSHGSEIGTTFEHFVGDRVERPAGSPLRPRLNSASWSVENDISTDSLHDTRAPSVDTSDRTVTVDADVGGPKVSHDSMMEALTKTKNDIEHELSGGEFVFPNSTLTDGGERQREASGQAVASISETFEASGDPAIIISAN
ncbi:hypothetical protein [Haloarcula montana]|uniref:hypothetical protein n=1 Tax=Haloarcula montana TaxID=3111776 RepID=UPI002D778358|nr:hypothetical protein [Haloarcula sp. GH36]